jgi:hypothetical protein
MKGRTLADQNRMKTGGVTKMNVGGSLIDRSRAAIAARAANPTAPKPKPNMQVPDAGKPKSQLGQRIDAIKARAVVNKAKVAANEQARKSAMEARAARKAAPLPLAGGMRNGGYTKKGRGYR